MKFSENFIHVMDELPLNLQAEFRPRREIRGIAENGRSSLKSENPPAQHNAAVTHVTLALGLCSVCMHEGIKNY